MFQVGEACYGTALQAAQAVASAQLGAVVNHGGSAYVVDLLSVTEASITYGLRPVGGGAPLQLVSDFVAQPCNLLGVEDGLSMGWMVAGVWVAVYAIVFIARTVFHVGGDNDGDA